MPTAQEVAGEFCKLLGMGNVVGVPFCQYAAVVTSVAAVDPTAGYIHIATRDGDPVSCHSFLRISCRRE